MESFRQYGQYWTMFLDPNNRPHDRQMAMCVFDDICEFLEEKSAQMVQPLYPIYLHSASACLLPPPFFQSYFFFSSF